MIRLERIGKDSQVYDKGIRFSMDMNGFCTFYLTMESAKDLRDRLNKLLNVR